MFLFESSWMLKLENRLLAFLIAIGTNAMRRLAIAHFFFKLVSERSPTIVSQLITVFFCFPCFEASHFFFKCTYFLSQRRLSMIGGEDFLLQFDRNTVADICVGHVLESLQCIYDGISARNSSKYVTYHDHSRC